MSCARESTVCVGAANRAAGARARMREMVFVKIIVGVGILWGDGRLLCGVPSIISKKIGPSWFEWHS